MESTPGDYKKMKRLETLAGLPLIRAEDLARRRPCSHAFACGYLDARAEIAHGMQPNSSLLNATDEYAKGYSAAYTELV